MTVVVDAGVIVALVVVDERQQLARQYLEDWLRADEQLHAPAVLPYEIANVLARMVFDQVLQLDEITDIWRDIAAIGLVLDPFDLARDGARVAAITAQLRRRHATDATYIRLAERLGTDVWTLDGPLARNAADAGLPVKLIS